MRTKLVCVVSGALALLVPLSVAAGERPSWIVSLDDDEDLSPIEERYGIDLDEIEFEPFWQGGMYFDRDSATEAMLEQAGVPDPVHAEGYEPSPGILYVEMNGVHLSPNCPNGDGVNAALNCSPLVEGETDFPPFGDGGQQAAVFQELSNYYEPFNIVMSTNRPPDWVPYTMAVIGGSAGLAGQPGGVCGVANVQCDGLKRNHVSLSFPQSCGAVADIAAQETAHNWGLEHTNNPTDLMYPTLTGGFKTFLDDCMTVDNSTGSGMTQCGYIHEVYCPSGGGEQQNSYGELMGVFGPREADDEPPQILSIDPPDGSAFVTADSFVISAMVAENTNFLAMKWTLEGGGGEPFTRCTNEVCNDGYDYGTGFDFNGETIEFVGITEAPEGEYTVTFEVMDAYGGYQMALVRYYVNEMGVPPATSTDTDPSGSGSATDVTASGGSGEEAEGGSSDEGEEGGSDTDTDPGIDDGGEKGCNCTTGGGAGGLALLVLGAMRRRRRRA